MQGSDSILVFLTLAAIGLLVLLVTRWKVNAFIALALASLLVGAGAVWLGVQAVPPAGGAARTFTMIDVVDAFQTGLGRTLGSIAAVISLGTMLGKLLAESGGAEVLARRFNAFFGPRRIGWCIIALALAVGLATWFAVGLVLLVPVLLTLTRETKRPFLMLAIPLLSFLSVMHGLMPPHPGPVVAIAKLHASMGKVLFWGFLIGIPTAAVAGPLFARLAARHVEAQPPPMPEKSGALPPGLTLPPFGLTLFTIVLPVLLMLVGTLVELTHQQATLHGNVGLFIGNPTVALLASVLFAMWSLGLRCGYDSGNLLKFTEQSVTAIGMTLLIVGGGGGFARVLTDAGVARTLGALAGQAHLSPLLYGWLVSAFIRVSTGSATVAITVTSDLMIPVLALHPEINVELLIIAIGCGSLFLSHLNDGGFWVVRDYLGLTVGQTLRTWTITETIIGIAGLIITLGVHSVWQMIFGEARGLGLRTHAPWTHGCDENLGELLSCMDEPRPAINVVDSMLESMAQCLPPDALAAIANHAWAPELERRIEELAEKANEGSLSPAESAEYDRIIEVGDTLTLLRLKARLRTRPAA